MLPQKMFLLLKIQVQVVLINKYKGRNAKVDYVQ